MMEQQTNPLASLRSLEEILELFVDAAKYDGRFIPVGSGYAVVFDDDEEFEEMMHN